MDGKAIYLRALKPISANEEVFVNYVDTTEPFINRQSELVLRYYFACTCQLCRHGPTTRLDKFSHPFSESSSIFKDETRAYLAQHTESILNQGQYSAFDVDSALLVAAESKIDQEYALTKQSYAVEEEVAAIKRICRTCQDSGIWPVYRFPYAQARQNLAVLYLSHQQYLDALPHLAKLYLDIYPVLLPEAHHPMRVANAISLVKLLVAVAGTSEAPRLPLDIPATLTAVGKEALDNAVKCHGSGSSFTKICLGILLQAYDEIQLKDENAWSEARRVEALRLLKDYADSARF
jgi:SET and MYND domain-containing protein